MKNNCVTLFFAALFCSFWGSYYLPVFSQISMTPIAQSPLQVLGDDRNTFEDLNFRSMLCVEDISARTEFTASYKTEDGYIRVEHSQKPIHRKVNGIWEKIDPSMKPNDDGWYAPMQQYPVYLKTNGAFSLSLTDGQTWSFGAQTQCLG